MNGDDLLKALEDVVDREIIRLFPRLADRKFVVAVVVLKDEGDVFVGANDGVSDELWASVFAQVARGFDSGELQ